MLKQPKKPVPVRTAHVQKEETVANALNITDHAGKFPDAFSPLKQNECMTAPGKHLSELIQNNP